MSVEKGHCTMPDDGRIQLIRRFQAIGHKLKRLGDENLAEKGLTFSQLRVLAHLLRRQGESVLQRELEEVLGIRRSSVTALLQNLEKAGLVRRESVPEDGRQKRIFITEKGLSLDRELRAYMDDLEAEIENLFTPAEAERLNGCLARILDKLIDMEQG